MSGQWPVVNTANILHSEHINTSSRESSRESSQCEDVLLWGVESIEMFMACFLSWKFFKLRVIDKYDENLCFFLY